MLYQLSYARLIRRSFSEGEPRSKQYQKRSIFTIFSAIIFFMSKNKIIIFLAICVALLPLLGFPRAWESFFQVFAGLAIIAVSVWATIDRKLSMKAKAQMRQVRKVLPPEVTSDVLPTVIDNIN